MANDVRIQWSGVTTVVCTLAGLADNALRESTVVQNSANRYLDALFQATCVANTAAVLTAVGAPVYFYAYAGIISTQYSGGATGLDAAFNTTQQDPNALKLVGSLPLITMGAAAVTVYYSDLFSVAAAFGGNMPINWGIVVENQTGQALNSAALQYQGLYVTIS